MNIIIKTDERKNAESAALRDYGINPKSATIAQREYAEYIAAGERDIRKEFKRMEE
ncbi:hypothetical protein FACS189490_11600 [Clostridia bacterium]|nr:hypothetical protein FACS189490_11600 [Clostridia bacterium]